MVILGLGSNEGYCLQHLRRAVQLLKQHPSISVIAISHVYQSDALLPDNAPPHWHRPYLNAAVSLTTPLQPNELIKVLKAMERALGREQQAARWSPRVVDIDLLAWDQHHQCSDELTIPHQGLLQRPFALWPLLDLDPTWTIPTPGPMQGKKAAELALAWGDPCTGMDAPLHTRRIAQRIDTPALVGIVNVTPDSFAHSKPYADLDAVIAHVIQMAEDGADIIDIGAESTRPGATPLNATQEWERLAPVLDALKHIDWQHKAYRPQISIDSYHADIIERCIDWGVPWINDVSGRWASHFLPQHPELHWVFMRPKTAPPPAPGSDCVQTCLQWAMTQYQALRELGVSAKRFAFDPGISFGWSAQQSYTLLRHLPELKKLPMPLYIGHSRKSFLGHHSTIPAHERDPETLAISLHCARHCVDYLRIHQVAWHARAFALEHHLHPHTLKTDQTTSHE